MDILTCIAVFSDGSREEIEFCTAHDLHIYWRKMKKNGRSVVYFLMVETIFNFFGENRIPRYAIKPNGKRCNSTLPDLLSMVIDNPTPIASGLALIIGKSILRK
jgi:hypothetical protein